MRDGCLRYNEGQKKQKEVAMEEVFEIIPQAKSVAVYSDGAKSEFAADSSEFAEILKAWKKMTEGAHQMPAFGVSIDQADPRGDENGELGGVLFFAGAAQQRVAVRCLAHGRTG